MKNLESEKGGKTAAASGTAKTAATLAREAAGLSPAQFARKVGLTSGDYIRQIERRGEPCPVRAERMARVLGCRVDVYLQPLGKPQHSSNPPISKPQPKKSVPKVNLKSQSNWPVLKEPETRRRHKSKTA